MSDTDSDSDVDMIPHQPNTTKRKQADESAQSSDDEEDFRRGYRNSFATLDHKGEYSPQYTYS